MHDTNGQPKIYYRTDPCGLVDFLIERWEAKFPSIKLREPYHSDVHHMFHDIADSNAFDHPLSPTYIERGFGPNAEMETVSLGTLFIHGAIMALSVQKRGYVEPDFLISLLIELLEMRSQFHVERRYDQVHYRACQPFPIGDGLSMDFDVRVPKARFF
ncbi:hypothetical protein [Mesorhizobium sp. Cs1321R2N1]|uniref:hypothetical protein n=1 Tax=Mesorhizobium sp. Cs1321R2N1 TaxID=3015174 RepID=UPI00301B7E17